MPERYYNTIEDEKISIDTINWNSCNRIFPGDKEVRKFCLARGQKGVA
jgi:hypothetical protein